MKKKKEGPTAEAKKANSRNNSNGSNKGAAVSSGAFINYNEVTEMIRHQYKIDGKENGLSDFKAVCNHTDAEFVRFLDWTAGHDDFDLSSISPTKQRASYKDYTPGSNKGYSPNGKAQYVAKQPTSEFNIHPINMGTPKMRAAAPNPANGAAFQARTPAQQFKVF